MATRPVEKTTHCPTQPLEVKACQNEKILVTARTTHSRWGGDAALTRMCIDLHAGYSFPCLLWNHKVVDRSLGLSIGSRDPPKTPSYLQPL